MAEDKSKVQSGKIPPAETFSKMMPDFGRNTAHEAFQALNKTVCESLLQHTQDFSRHLENSHTGLREVFAKNAEQAGELAECNRKNLACCAQSGKVINDTWQEVIDHLVTGCREMTEDTSEMIRSLNTVESPPALMALQNRHMQKMISRFMSDLRFVSEASLKVCEAQINTVHNLTAPDFKK